MHGLIGMKNVSKLLKKVKTLGCFHSSNKFRPKQNILSIYRAGQNCIDGCLTQSYTFYLFCTDPNDRIEKPSQDLSHRLSDTQ